MIVCHWAAVNSPGLRTIWQRLQLRVHSSAPDRGSAFTEVVVSTLVWELGAGVCAIAGKVSVTTAAQMVATAKRYIDLIERALVSLEVGIARLLESVGNLEEKRIVWQGIGAMIVGKFIVRLKP